jgi:hypothetical protein
MTLSRGTRLRDVPRDKANSPDGTNGTGGTKGTQNKERNAARQRLRAARKAEGRAVLPVDVPLFDLADALVAEKLLCEWDADDRGKVAEALTRVVRSWIASRVSG